MRPSATNSKTIQSLHWAGETFPLQGFICFYKDPTEGFEKRHYFVTSNTDRKDHFDYTVKAMRAVLNDLLPKTGRKRHLIFVSDGCTRQASSKTFLLLIIYCLTH